MEKVAKKEITKSDYDKKVEIAMAHYEYFDRLTREEAIAAAKKAWVKNVLLVKYLNKLIQNDILTKI